MAISKKTRFEIFKRDGFKCFYCGKTPPGVILEVDHIDPKALGGKDDEANLLTACFDCNRGKRDIPLSSIPQGLQDNMEQMQEKENQIKAYRKFMKSIQKRKNADIEYINEIYGELPEPFKQTSLKMFIEKIPLNEVEDAMRKACARIRYGGGRATIRYFCGICWNIIRANEKKEPAHVEEKDQGGSPINLQLMRENYDARIKEQEEMFARKKADFLARFDKQLGNP
jgi:hypothetical protein